MAELIDKAKTFLAEKVANVKMPEASVADVDLKRVSLDSIEYLAKVSVENTSGCAIPVCEIDYTLKSASGVIASGKIPDPGSLKAEDTTLLEVPVKVRHSLLVSLVKDVVRDWDIDYEILIDLIIDLPLVGNVTIPLSRKREIKLPTLSEVF